MRMKNIEVQELKKRIDSRDKIVIVDVRTPGELVRGKIEDSINIPLDSFEDRIEVEIPDKNEHVYLICLSGSRSVVAAQIMDHLGYRNVFNVISGMLAWRSKGYPQV